MSDEARELIDRAQRGFGRGLDLTEKLVNYARVLEPTLPEVLLAGPILGAALYIAGRGMSQQAIVPWLRQVADQLEAGEGTL